MARSSEGRRYRKQPKIDALRQYKEEILEAHRSGLSVHRIAQIFRERGVDISVPHLVRTVRRFVDEEERVAGRSPGPGRPASPMAQERHPESVRLKKQSQRRRSRTRLLNNPAQGPGGGICEAIAACALPGRGRLAAIAATGAGSLRRKRLSERNLLQRRGQKPRRGRSKKAREEELAKERRRAGRWVRRWHHPIRAEGRNSGLVRDVKSAAFEIA